MHFPHDGEDLLICNLLFWNTVLHQWFLAMFGLPIGECFKLDELAEYCAKVGRYSFLLTSVPMNVPGLIGSPPNALALM